MVELYGRDVSVISRHINNVFKEGEVEKESNLHFLQIAGSDRPTAFYSLDVIISVGYRAFEGKSSKMVDSTTPRRRLFLEMPDIKGWGKV